MKSTKLAQPMTVILAVVALTTLIAPAVKAHCLASAPGAGMLAPGFGNMQDRHGFDQNESSSDQAGASDSGLGFWKRLEYTGGVVSDIGFDQMSAGGTELLNDTGPSGGGNNFCMGVWKRIGARTYAVVHPFFIFDTSGKAVAIAIERSRFTVAKDGNTLSGTWTQDNYDFSGNVLPDTHSEGTIAGTRITPEIPFPFPFPFLL